MDMRASSMYTSVKGELRAYEIIEVEKHTDTEWSFRIECDLNVGYGQYFDVVIPMHGESPVPISDFGCGYVELFVQRDTSATTREMFKKCIGDCIWLQKASGAGYTLNLFQDRSLVIIAEGAGVGAVKGLISHYCREPYLLKSLDVIVGFKDTKSVLFREEMKAWNESVNFLATIDEPTDDEFFETGLVTQYTDIIDMREKKDVRVVVAGSHVLVRSVAQIFSELGLPKRKIWACYERRLLPQACGCNHCLTKQPFTCAYGPVIRYDKAIKL